MFLIQHISLSSVVARKNVSVEKNVKIIRQKPSAFLLVEFQNCKAISEMSTEL